MFAITLMYTYILYTKNLLCTVYFMFFICQKIILRHEMVCEDSLTFDLSEGIVTLSECVITIHL